MPIGPSGGHDIGSSSSGMIGFLSLFAKLTSFLSTYQRFSVTYFNYLTQIPSLNDHYKSMPLTKSVNS